MKKFLALLLIFVIVVSSVSVFAAKKQKTRIDMTVNGTLCSFDQMPVLLNERVIVPMRGMFEMLGANVSWDPLHSEVSGELDGVTVKLKVGYYDAYVNGTHYKLDVPSQIVNGRTLIPVRFVAEAFGAEVIWDDETKTVHISGIGKKSQETEAAGKFFDRFADKKLILDEPIIFDSGKKIGTEYGEITVVKPDDIIYGTALSMKSTKKAPNPIDFRFEYNKFPELGALDNLCIKVVFRTTKCDYAVGYGKLGIELSSSDGERIHYEELKAGSSWTTYYIPVASRGSINKVSFVGGFPDQTIEISQFKVLNFKELPLDILPDNVTGHREQ